MRSQQIVKRSKNLSHAVHIFLLCRKSKLFGELSKHLCAHFYRRGLGFKGHKIVVFKDVSTVKYLVRLLRWWAESAPVPPGWNRVKVSENLGAKAVIPVVSADTSLELNTKKQLV